VLFILGVVYAAKLGTHGAKRISGRKHDDPQRIAGAGHAGSGDRGELALAELDLNDVSAHGNVMQGAVLPIPNWPQDIQRENDDGHSVGGKRKKDREDQ